MKGNLRSGLGTEPDGVRGNSDVFRFAIEDVAGETLMKICLVTGATMRSVTDVEQAKSKVGDPWGRTIDRDRPAKAERFG